MRPQSKHVSNAQPYVDAPDWNEYLKILSPTQTQQQQQQKQKQRHMTVESVGLTENMERNILAG
ncbi:uncharacterized protein Dvir_GJ25657 [Drosophila virilis]|uniref:Uncharacterized protein n=1 Tax=Drosophila virilis TaxID=7244 RepID=A0A0Q9WYK1_DROVI|nr:uncharacterized protein Dvir_GJ25657 [Drosophila virilis]